MAYITIPKATISHYTYNGAENGTPKITEYEGKKYASFTIQEAIAVWNNAEQKNDFKYRQWKCKLSGFVAEQFEREYDMDPDTRTEITITMSKLKDIVDGKITHGKYTYKAFADVIDVHAFTLKNVSKSEANESTVGVSHNTYDDKLSSEPSHMIDDDIPF